jgi:hypothetical protein
MQRNVGGNDRLARFGIGAVLVTLGVAGYAGVISVAVGPLPQALTAVVLALFGVVLLVTGGLQYCPLNQLLGVDTCPRSE